MGILARIFGGDKTVRDANRFETRAFDLFFDWRFTDWGMKVHLAARTEAALHRCLLTDAGRRSYFCEHDLDGLLRGDIKSRFETYRLGRETGALSANDIRRRENMPPIADGNTYSEPANWKPLGGSAAI